MSRKIEYPFLDPEPVRPGGSETRIGPVGIGSWSKSGDLLQVFQILGSKMLDPVTTRYPINLDV